jgi:O-antigen/teichoic acid export membrane protein
MKTTKAALAILLICGGLLLVLGIVIWTGNGDALIPVHIAIGIVLVLALWIICVMAVRSERVAPTTVAVAAAWGVLIVLLGLAQEDLLVGSWHWTIQVLHLAISMGAIWWGRRLVRLMRPAQPSQEPGAPRVSVVSRSTH